MITNEIKKLLYKEKMEAKIHSVSYLGIKYKAYLEITNTPPNIYESFEFFVPMDDVLQTKTSFDGIMPARLLIRYFVDTEEKTKVNEI